MSGELSQSLVAAAAEAIEERLKTETGGCRCDPMWKERGRVDPDCAYHYDVGEQFAADAARAAVAAVLETLAAHYYERGARRSEAAGDPPQCDGDCRNDDCHTTSATAAWQMAAATAQRVVAELRGDGGTHE